MLAIACSYLYRPEAGFADPYERGDAGHPSRLFANALVNVAWRIGPVEDIHAGSFRGYPLTRRRVTPAEEKELMQFASNGLALGLTVCPALIWERPPRSWPEQVSGSDPVYEPILRFLYTRPIYAIEVELRATEDNIATRRKLGANPEVPSEIREEIRKQSDVMAAHPGEFVSTEPRGFLVETYDAVLPYPRRVVVLIDGAGSSGEQFLLAARQSHKVTLFGQRNSAGVLDFANVAEMPTTSGRFLVRWAISRSMRLPADPVDPDGIPPDIRIPADVEDPVGYAQAWLERQID